MAKRKKPATKPATRRTPRRVKKSGNNTAPVDGESTAPVEPSPPSTSTDPESTPVANTSSSEAPSTSIPKTSDQTLTKPCQVPIVALHKKFGKYRLFTNEDTFTRKYEIGSDSETNSSIEIRVVDPCASSESDSNMALDTQSDTTSGAANFSPLNKAPNISQSNSRDISPSPMLNEVPPTNEISLLSNDVNDSNKNIELAKLPTSNTVKSNELTKSELSDPQEIKDQNVIENSTNASVEDTNQVNQNIPAEDLQIDHMLYSADDEEVITIVQIVEDDNQELYYNIKIDSPQEDNKEQNNMNIELDKEHDGEFQTHFAKLNLSNSAELVANSLMDCSGSNSMRIPPCNTPDLQVNDILSRPDPSLTPSSTLSDDSNSSRITEHNQNNSNDSAESSPTGVRRSNRIKTISTLKQKTKGYGLVKTPLKKALITQTKLKLEEMGSDSQEKPVEIIPNNTPNSPSFPVPSDMPVKVKSRWRRSSELEMGANSPANSPLASPSLPQSLKPLAEVSNLPEEESSIVPMSKEAYDRIIEDRMKQYQHLDENEYLCERMISKDTKKMICDCFMTKEELERGELGCGEDCLNRLLMIECNSRCPMGDRCTNRRFQKRENAPLKIFYADKKGCGVEGSVDIPAGEFLMEYVGEVLDYEQFYKRAQAYSDENNLHHYFMSLKGDTVIDATGKGNISRFINHSCDPNAETQKWTVNGELRIGFFSKRDIIAGEEITFDYQFKRFGKEAQRCYCGADNCRGWIGGEPDSEDEEDEEEEEDDVSTSKSGTTESSEEALADATAEAPRPRRRARTYKPPAPDLVQDADIEDDLEALSRTGVKNQSHTLRLSRTVVRAKTRRAQTALLRLLRDADLPCRRLFLDYRGLRLLAPWCADAPLDFRLEMLQTVDRLPIPNKTMVHESRFFTIVERWLSSTPVPQDTVFIDEATGLPVDLPNRTQENAVVADKNKESAAILEKVKDLSSQLLERWSSLKEVFKIPKKERIQQMKEHERQANVERRAADSSGSRDRERDRERERERDRERERERERRDEREHRDREREREREREKERYRERDRERDRERERDRDDRDRRKRRGSPEGRRSIRLSERVLTAVPPMTKEERRRAFAEAAAAADETRRQRDRAPAPAPHPPHAPHPPPGWPFWPQHEQFTQMFPGGMMGAGGGMLSALVPPALLPPADLPADYPPPGFCPPFAPQPFCVPQHNIMGMGGFGMGGFMFGQQMAGGGFPPQPPQPPRTAQPPHPSQPPPIADLQQPGVAPTEEPTELVLPSMWRSAKDTRGRTYYYHVKLRQPQWTPPAPPSDELGDESSSEEEDEPLNALDTAIVKRQIKGKWVEGVNGIYEVIKEDIQNGLIPEHALLSMKSRKRRPGLVSERPISPRTEEDKLAGKLEVKRYKQTKERLRRKRERLLHKVRLLAAKHRRGKDLTHHDLKMVDLVDSESDLEGDSDEVEAIQPEATSAPIPASAPAPAPTPASPPAPSPSPVAAPPADAEETARRIKEQFRSSMARVMVHHLNPYRHSDAPAGRITCTADFKHLARKLTHFVMLKELKHCRTVEELVVTDSVRSKAKEFVRKYMAKFGPVYRRPPEEAD